MKFKKFKKPTPAPSYEDLTKRTILEFKDFFDEIKLKYPEVDYEQWSAEAAFVLRVNPSIDKNKITPPNITEFFENELIKQKKFTF